MTPTEPLVSVLMTAFNRQEFISEAIESVLESSYKNFELIIVDDCSNDKTVSLAKKYEALDSRIKVFLNAKNVGDYPNRNLAISYSRGEFIMFVDSDDKIYPFGIEKCINAMLKNPDAEYAIYSTTLFREKPLKPKESIAVHFFQTPFLIVGPGGTIQKRDFAINIGLYPEKYGPANDMYYHLNAASKTNTLILNFEFVYYRRHAGQEINNKAKYLIYNYLYLNDAISELELYLSKEQKEWILKKNKRRHFVNLLFYLFREKNLKIVFRTINLTRFSCRDVIIAIFQR